MTDTAETVAPSIAEAVAGASRAARPYAARPAAARRDDMYAVAQALAADVNTLVSLALEETGLTEARLRAEMDRTTGQLRLLGDFVAEGRHRSGLSSPGSAPDGSDVVQVAVPLGPVAVFAASNFPLAFGVPGGDTASALAAGCPVVVRAHPAQPRTSRALAATVVRALADAGAPGGVFSLVEGADYAVSTDLVKHPAIRAVGFTGSLGGGRALLSAAASRPDPIPVYAEMGSLNPVFVFPGAAANTAHLDALAAAVTGSAGQLCTKPGLVVVPDDATGRTFAERLTDAVASTPVHGMLTPGMTQAHADWRVRAAELATVTTGDGAAFALLVEADQLDGELVEEHFGPSVVVATSSPGAYAALAAGLDGSLTATILATAEEQDSCGPLVAALAERAGRIVLNGVPTGVAVCDAMHHGGPWPSSSVAYATSVGTLAIQRFLRPVALQGLPVALLESFTLP